jgi:hypothetical protein
VLVSASASPCRSCGDSSTDARHGMTSPKRSTQTSVTLART